MTTPSVSTLPPPPPPANPPDALVRSALTLARPLALVVSLVAGVLTLAFLILAVYGFLHGGGSFEFLAALYCLASAVVNLLLWREIPKFQALQGPEHSATLRDRLLLWSILGFAFFVVVGAVLAFVWVKLDLALAHPGGAPPGSGTPPVCLRCGQRSTWIPERQKYYCYRCAAYLW